MIPSELVWALLLSSCKGRGPGYYKVFVSCKLRNDPPLRP